ncbi:MAG: VCBS repeat-containing protein [Myxococcales bacterium]|nr:VCBS repeat-containing protein [Myxococcales bacterium]
MFRSSPRLSLLVSLAAALFACSDAETEGDDGGGGGKKKKKGGEGGEGGSALPEEPTTHFEAEAATFSLPVGGKHLAGFNDLSGEPGDANDVEYGAQRWRLIDLDGDGDQDLVITASAVPREGYYYWSEVPGYNEGAPTWYVFKNNGSGFDAEPTAWSVPVGGQHLAGFNDLSGEAGNASDVTYGAQRWRTTDIDGDGLPDIVVTSSAVPREGYYYWDEVPGYNEGAPTWYVFKNNGSGFDAEPTAWSVPVGGKHLAGFNDLSGEAGSASDVTYGAQRWRMLDVDGDARQDIVVTASAVPREGYYYWDEVPGYNDGAPTWYVFKNNGSGFDADPTAWSVPVGGQHKAGFNDVGGEPGNADDVSMGAQRWSVMDINTDGRPDLLVTGEATPREGYYYWVQVFGFDVAPQWWVYLGQEEGFAAEPQPWSLPFGGKHLAGFNAPAGEPGDANDVAMGDDRWRLTDLDGDKRLDLVITGEATPREGYYYWVEVLGLHESSPYWQIYRGAP